MVLLDIDGSCHETSSWVLQQQHTVCCIVLPPSFAAVRHARRIANMFASLCCGKNVSTEERPRTSYCDIAFLAVSATATAGALPCRTEVLPFLQGRTTATGHLIHEPSRPKGPGSWALPRSIVRILPWLSNEPRNREEDSMACLPAAVEASTIVDKASFTTLTSFARSTSSGSASSSSGDANGSLAARTPP